MWEGQALPHDTKFGNSRCEIVGRRVIFIWSLIHRSSWSGLIKVGPGIILLAFILINETSVYIITEVSSKKSVFSPAEDGDKSGSRASAAADRDNSAPADEDYNYEDDFEEVTDSGQKKDKCNYEYIVWSRYPSLDKVNNS